VGENAVDAVESRDSKGLREEASDAESTVVVVADSEDDAVSDASLPDCEPIVDVLGDSEMIDDVVLDEESEIIADIERRLDTLAVTSALCDAPDDEVTRDESEGDVDSSAVRVDESVESALAEPLEEAPPTGDGEDNAVDDSAFEADASIVSDERTLDDTVEDGGDVCEDEGLGDRDDRCETDEVGLPREDADEEAVISADVVGTPLNDRVALLVELTVEDADGSPEADDVDDDVCAVEPVATANEMLGVVDEVPLGDTVSETNVVKDWGTPEPEAVMLAAPSLLEDVGVTVATFVADTWKVLDTREDAVGDALDVLEQQEDGETAVVALVEMVAKRTDGDADEDEMLLWLLITVNEGRGETENEEVTVIVDICVSEPVGLDEGLDRALKVSATKEAEEFAVSEENALIDAIEVAVDDAEISDDIVWVAQLVNEPDAVSEGLALGVTDDDSELVPHEVRESRGENVLEAESVGPTGLPDAIPDNELDPDEVGDELALEDERNEGVTEGEWHAVDDALSDPDTVPLPHAENDEVSDAEGEPVDAPEPDEETDGVRQGTDDAEKVEDTQPLDDWVALRDCKEDPENECDPVAHSEGVRLRRDDVEPVEEWVGLVEKEIVWKDDADDDS
jgi:hypothetical protein